MDFVIDVDKTITIMPSKLILYRVEYIVTGSGQKENTIELVETEKETSADQLEDVMSILKKRLTLDDLTLDKITICSITKMAE